MPSPKRKAPKARARRDGRIRAFIGSNRGVRVTVVTPQGASLTVLCGDPVSNRLLRKGNFEPQLSALLETLATRPLAFIDVGANIGFFSVMVGMLQPRSRILAIEPNPFVAEIAAANISANGVNGVVVPCGVADSSGTMVLTYPRIAPSLGTLGSVPPDQAFGETESVEVPTRTLDDLMREHRFEAADVLKIDAEGFDVRILLSLPADRARRIDHIVCEFSEQRLLQCRSSRADLLALPWLDEFEAHVIDCLALPLKLESLETFPSGAEILWLRRKRAAAKEE